MLFEITNPSDALVIEHDDPMIASVATLLLGSGSYGLRDVNGESVMPIFIFGGVDEWLKGQGIEDLSAYIDQNVESIAGALASVLYGRFGAAADFKSAVEKMTPDNAVTYRAEWNDRRRTSMNNIGKKADQLAQRLRERLAPAAV